MLVDRNRHTCEGGAQLGVMCVCVLLVPFVNLSLTRESAGQFNCCSRCSG